MFKGGTISVEGENYHIMNYYFQNGTGGEGGVGYILADNFALLSGSRDKAH